MERGDRFDAVLEAAKAGDGSALSSLYRDLHPGILRYLLVRSPGEAEDLAADVWIDVAAGLGRFQGDEEGFRGWVFTIARRRLADAARRRARRPTVPVSMDRLARIGEVGDVEQEAIRGLETEAALRGASRRFLPRRPRSFSCESWAVSTSTRWPPSSGGARAPFASCSTARSGGSPCWANGRRRRAPSATEDL